MAADTPIDPRIRAQQHRPVVAEARWQVRLLGAVQASDGVRLIERFPSRAAASLLARLALEPGRDHAREELVELLWPGVALTVGRNRLRQTLSSLKSLLEPAGAPLAPVIQADRASVRVVAGAMACDATAFERALRGGRSAEAAALYQGELMPGFYDEWIDDERTRLRALYERLQEAPPPASLPAFTAAPVDAVLSLAPLPLYLSRLFGAEMAAARLRAQLHAHRLVTLVGPGGSGKTRLAVEVAQALRDAPDWPAGAAARFDRVGFAPLATCSDAAAMLDAVARSLRLPSSVDALEPLADALAGLRVLLVLDNFEQLVDCAAASVAALLQRLPGLHVLATSRRPLALEGERVVQAEPLPLPADASTLAAAAVNPAVALFVDRARAARADFHLHERNVADIVTLVRGLDGMPLAIELAASRVRSIAPAEMAALLVRAPGAASRALPLLSRSGARGWQERRHASMEEVIAWSWRQLDDAARQTLAALTVFHGAASTAAVAAVLDDADAAATALRLDELVSHSLARALPAADGTLRFGLYEPIREFAAARIDAGGARTLRQRLRDWIVRWARSLGPAALPGRVAAELPEVHAAIVGAAADGAPLQALQIALALRDYWDTDGMPGSSLHALVVSLDLAQSGGEVDAGTLAGMHELLAYLAFETGSAAEARRHADSAIVAAGADPSRRARALVRRAWVDIAAGRSGGPDGAERRAMQALIDEALQLARACGDHEAQARGLQQAAILLAHVDADHAAAERLFEQSQRLWLELGDRRKAFARLRNRAQCWANLGRPADAMAAYRECEQAAQEDGDWVGLIDNTLSMTMLLAEQRRWAEAHVAVRRAVALSWQRWHRHGLAYALWNPPRILARLRRPEAAMRLLAFAVELWTRGFAPLTAADRHYVRVVRRLVQVQVGTARAEALWIEGSSMTLPAAVALALQD